MSEAEWLSSDDPKHMLEYLRNRMSERKLRLCVCGWCLQMWDDKPAEFGEPRDHVW